jgi:NTE family protein
MPFRFFYRLTATILIGVVVVQGQVLHPARIGIALRGGGALGFAHIGALEVIDSLQIPIDYIAGTSMGAFIGGLYAIGYSPQEIEHFLLNIDWDNIFDDTPPRQYLPFLIKKNSGRYQLELAIEGFSPTLPGGLIAGQKIYELIFSKTYLYEGISSFDELPIPFRCVGSDLVSSKEVVFKDGSLARAIRASMSIPTIFDPVRYGDQLIVDGALLNNFPVDVVKEMGADFVIGLNLTQPPKDQKYYNNLIKILDRTMDLPRAEKLQQTIEMADLLIDQDIGAFSMSDFDTVIIRKIIRQGKIAAYKNLEKLLSLKSRSLLKEKKEDKVIKTIEISGNGTITSEQLRKILKIREGGAFSADALQASVKRYNGSTVLLNITYRVIAAGPDSVMLLFDLQQNMTPRLKSVWVEGNVEISETFILNFLGLKSGETFDRTKFLNNIKLLYGMNYFKEIGFKIRQHPDRSVSLTIQVREKSPRKFLFGIHYDDFYKLVATVGLRAHSVLLPGLYIESDIQFSGLTRFDFNLYYPSRSFDLPVYPILSIAYSDLPFDVYSPEGFKILRYNQRGWSFGGGIRINPELSLNLEAELAVEYPDIVLEIGNPVVDQTGIKDKLILFRSDLDLDILDNVLVPSNGLKLTANLEVGTKSLGSDYHFVRLHSLLDIYQTFSAIHTLRVAAMYLRSWQDAPFYKSIFYIGGPLTFVGLDYLQTYGTRFSIIRTEYRLEFLQDIFVKGMVNSALDYKLGLAQESVSGKPFWGFGFSFLYNSMLGPLELWFTWGNKTPYQPDVMISRIYFTAGYRL